MSLGRKTGGHPIFTLHSFFSVRLPGNRDARREVAKRFRRLAARAERRGAYKTLGALTFRARMSFKCLFPSSDNVNMVRHVAGKSRLRQILDNLLLVLVCRFEPATYYMLGLFEPERFARAADFISFRQYVNINHYVFDRSGATSDIVNNKARFAAFCQERGISTPGTLVLLRPTVPESIAAESLIASHREAFFKPNDGGCGVGAGVIVLDENGRWRVKTNEVGRQGQSWLDVLEFLSTLGDEILIQPVLSNHPDMAVFGSHALHTVRMLTLQFQGAVQLCNATLKLAEPWSVIDNYIAGGMAVSVGIDDGVLGNGARKAADSLPASEIGLADGAVFKGRRLPCWQEAVDLVVRLHREMPEFASLGHDVALTPDGASIIEVNSIWDGGIFQKPLDIGLVSSVYPDFVEEWFAR